MSDQNLKHVNFCATNRFSSSYDALNTMRSARRNKVRNRNVRIEDNEYQGTTEEEDEENSKYIEYLTNNTELEDNDTDTESQILYRFNLFCDTDISLNSFSVYTSDKLHKRLLKAVQSSI